MSALAMGWFGVLREKEANVKTAEVRVQEWSEEMTLRELLFYALYAEDQAKKE